jgi:hypothetical protein
MKVAKDKTMIKPVVAVLTISAILVGCTGMSSYEPRNNREEGPEKGLFSGSQGEFVIYRGGPSTEVTKTKPEEASPVQ